MTNFTNILDKVKFANEIWVFIIPGVLMAVDILTGSLNAWAKSNFKSFKMREGLVKKCGEITILAIGQLFTVGLVLPTYIMSGISFYIIFMELISICENLQKMGVPIPKFIKKALDDTEKALEEKESVDSKKEDTDDGGNSK
jgi:toxin secretion/phage lysis holin